MKLNLEVEIDWIDEEQGIDEVVKQSIIDSVVNQIGNKVNDRVQKEVDKIINEQITSKISDRIGEMFDAFASEPVKVRDEYGDVKAQYDSVREMLKARFDKFLTEMVDDSGKPSTYGNKMTRTEYLFKYQINKFADDFTKTTVKQVSEEVKKTVQEGLTQRLGAELMTVLKVNELIGLPEGRK